jgi:phosphoglycerate dehydrogenase-like enzyme
VGLIGWSANARALAARLTAAGADVRVFSEHASDADIAEASRATLVEVLASDIVSLHRGLTPATRHFLGAAELSRLRPGTLLINIARGALIEPDALLQRLRQGDIFACLDTFENEPLPRNHPLRRLPNVFLTSHIAGGSGDMRAEAAKEVVGKVIRFLDGANADTISPNRLRTMT